MILPLSPGAMGEGAQALRMLTEASQETAVASKLLCLSPGGPEKSHSPWTLFRQPQVESSLREGGYGTSVFPPPRGLYLHTMVMLALKLCCCLTLKISKI